MNNRKLITSRRIATRRTQSGAALVVGMLLLLVLTLLAISGMNTASLELAMAGNMQFHENAFRAAEAGVEQAMAEGTFNPDPTLPAERFPETAGASIAIPHTSEDAFFATITVAMDGQPGDALPGSSLGKSVTYHFDVQSNGRSARNAVSTIDQGVAIIAPPSGVYTPGAGMPTTLTP